MIDSISNEEGKKILDKEALCKRLITIKYFSVCGEPVEDDEDDDKLDIEDDFREDLTIKNLPWMVSMGYFETPNNWKHQCGGSLITHR